MTSFGACSVSSRIQSKPEPAMTSAAVGAASVLHSPICWRPAASARLSELSGMSMVGVVNPAANGTGSLPGSSTASCRSCALCVHIHRVERLARGHEQAIALLAAETKIAAHFGKPDPAHQLALRRPDGHAAVADSATRVARAPDVSVHVAAHAVGPTLDAVDHELRKDA